jgi:hypothetical protein
MNWRQHMAFPSRESFPAYLELSIKFVEAHVIGVDTGNSLCMVVIMAMTGVCETDKKSKTDSRANDALASERHGSYICPLQTGQIVSFHRKKGMGKTRNEGEEMEYNLSKK